MPHMPCTQVLTYGMHVCGDAPALVQASNPNSQIQALLEEKARVIDKVKMERQALKDATIFYKIKAAEHKEYLQVGTPPSAAPALDCPAVFLIVVERLARGALCLAGRVVRCKGLRRARTGGATRDGARWLECWVRMA